MKNRSHLAAAVLASAAAVALAPAANAQAKYPDKPIRLVVPFAPGGETDLFGRGWAQRVSQHLGGSIFIDNKPGAGGSTGAAEVVRARPDGYTLLAGTSTTQIINPAAMAKPPYDPQRDFVPVQIVSTTPTSIVVNPAFPARNLQELIEVLKANPGKYAYGSAGAGTITHLTGELFKRYAGNLDVVHIPYKGAGPGLQDLMAGHLQIFTPIFSAGVLAQHRAGKLRVLAVNSDTRLRIAPDLPTASEAGLPDLRVEVFNVIAAPAGTPQAVIEALSQATDKAKAEPGFAQEVEQAGARLVMDSSPDKAVQFIKAELQRWTPLIKAAGFRVE